MAIAVGREQVVESAIAKALSIQPQLTYIQKRRRYQAPVVRFWRLDDDGRTLHLPFAWARSELKVEPRRPGAYELYRPAEEHLEFRGELYEDQKIPAVDALAELRRSGGVTLAMRTGFGKTVVGIWLAAQLQPFVVLLVYSFNTCEREWAGAFQEFTDAKIWKARKEKPPPDGFHVILCSVGTLSHIPPDILVNVGVLIVDEVHTFFTEIRTKALLTVHPRYVVAISATPEKENQMHRVLACLAGPTLIRVPGRVFRVRQVRTGIRPACDRDAEGGIVWHTLVASLVQSAARNEIIADEVARLVEAEGRKPLVMTARVAHTLELAALVAQRTTKKVSIFQGDMKTYEDGAVLLGTNGKLSTAFDEKAFVQAAAGVKFKRIDTVVIVFPVQDMALLTQIVGRAFRTDEMPLVVEFRDDHPATERHARKRNKLYHSLSVEVEVVEAPGAAAAQPKPAPDNADEEWLKSRVAQNRGEGAAKARKASAKQ
jgi:superfamily II DNA or RNA helicase